MTAREPRRAGWNSGNETRRHALKRRRRIRMIGLGVAIALVVAASAFARSGDGPAGKSRGGEHPTPPSAACGAAVPLSHAPQRYARSPVPGKVLDNGTDYGAVMHTSCGDITIDLLEGAAPKTVASFVFLAGKGFYDGLQWIRIERDFVIQAGDPNNRLGHGPDGAGYELPNEVKGTDATDYVYGTVGLANRGPGTGSSQFFVVVHKGENGNTRTPAGLSPIYTIFGRVDESSYETLDKIATREVKEGTGDPATAVEPINPVYIESVEITKA